MTEVPDKNAGEKLQAGWERDVLEKVLLATVVEQRRARRWNLIFKAFLLVYLGIGIWLVADPLNGKSHSGKSKLHTAVVDVVGAIAEGSETSADNIINGLHDAYEDKNTKGILLNMNSPGGTPVQAAYVWEEIRRLRKEYPDIPVYAVISDLCASGGYYIASAADKIYVNPSSVLGSIGVIMNGFGFVDSMEKLGVERRLLTAGEHKALLDPFSPVSPEEKAHIQEHVLKTIHHQFIESVRAGRGDRLKETPDIFSGLVWTGDQGIQLGLADDYGNLRSVAKTVVGAEELVNFTPRERLLDRVSHRLGASFSMALESALGMNRVQLR